MVDVTFLLVCLDCGHVERTRDDDLHIVDAKENSLTHLGSAELLRDIHAAKRPTHRPFIETHAGDDVHYPEWAEDYRDRIIRTSVK